MCVFFKKKFKNHTEGRFTAAKYLCSMRKTLSSIPSTNTQISKFSFLLIGQIVCFLSMQFKIHFKFFMLFH